MRKVFVYLLKAMLSLFVLQKAGTMLRNVCKKLEAVSMFGCVDATGMSSV